VPRNAFYGPHYSDIDVNLYKDVFKRESVTFQIGAQAYNALNQVNFAAPAGNASNLSSLGHISTDVNPPTSPYGSRQRHLERVCASTRDSRDQFSVGVLAASSTTSTVTFPL
jgi:hypothetical protein